MAEVNRHSHRCIVARGSHGYCDSTVTKCGLCAVPAGGIVTPHHLTVYYGSLTHVGPPASHVNGRNVVHISPHFLHLPPNVFIYTLPVLHAGRTGGGHMMLALVSE